MIRDIHAVSAKEGRFLYQLAKRSTGKGVIVEIGSWKGYSTIMLAKGSRANKGIDVHAVDPHTGSEIHHKMYGKVDTYEEFIQNITEAEVRGTVIPIRATSETAESNWGGRPIELLFIDGDHEDTEADFLRWSPYIIPGGIIAVHDTTTWPSKIPYKTVVKYFYKSGNFKYIRLLGSITYAIKLGKYSKFHELNNKDGLLARGLYQLLLPCFNLFKALVTKILGRI